MTWELVFDLRVGVDMTVNFDSGVLVRVDLLDDFDFNLGLNMSAKLELSLNV